MKEAIAQFEVGNLRGNFWRSLFSCEKRLLKSAITTLTLMNCYVHIALINLDQSSTIQKPGLLLTLTRFLQELAIDCYLCVLQVLAWV